MSENFGKIVQDKNSLTINSSDTSVSKATQLDYAIPAAKIAALSSGEFVGMVADNPEQEIELKMFHSPIQNDHEAIAKEEAGYQPIPVVEWVSVEMVQETYAQIKVDIVELFKKELASLEEEKPDTAKQNMNNSKGDDKPLSRRQQKRQEKLGRRKERANLRKLKNEANHKSSSERNGQSKSPVKNEDTEQVMPM